MWLRELGRYNRCKRTIVHLLPPLYTFSHWNITTHYPDPYHTTSYPFRPLCPKFFSYAIMEYRVLKYSDNFQYECNSTEAVIFIIDEAFPDYNRNLGLNLPS